MIYRLSVGLERIPPSGLLILQYRLSRHRDGQNKRSSIIGNALEKAIKKSVKYADFALPKVVRTMCAGLPIQAARAWERALPRTRFTACDVANGGCRTDRQEIAKAASYVGRCRI